MNLANIKEKADEETFDIYDQIQDVLAARTANPNGSDLHLPLYLIPTIEAYCDKLDIPFYHVNNTCCSVAQTYTQLLAYEQAR